MTNVRVPQTMKITKHTSETPKEDFWNKIKEDEKLAVKKHLLDLDSQIEKIQKEKEDLLKIVEKYPNIQRSVGRWNKVAYCTEEVNDKVTDYDSRHNCGCCDDSPLEVWPYLQTEIGKIYSYPSCFTIGERVSYSRDRPRDGWEKQLQEKNIPQALIDKMQSCFINEEDDDESIDDYAE